MWARVVRINPLCFQAGSQKKRLNLALVFLCLFCIVEFVVHCVSNECLPLFFSSFFSTKPRDWLGRTSLKRPILYQVWCKTLTQSVLKVLLWDVDQHGVTQEGNDRQVTESMCLHWVTVDVLSIQKWKLLYYRKLEVDSELDTSL